MRRRVIKYQRWSRARFSVDEKQRRRFWFEPDRWRSVATFDTLDMAVQRLRALEDDERQRADAEIGEQLEILFESDGSTWFK